MFRKRVLVGLVLLVAVVMLLPTLRSVETQTLDIEARAQADGRFVTTGIGTTHYESLGPENGEPVLLVHGFASPYYVWDATAPALAARGYRVIRFDLMGRGYSDRPDADYDADFLARQVNELLTGLNIQRPVNIVGYSMGGVVAAAFANQHPERVRRVALVAPFNTAKNIGPLGWPIVGDWLAKVVLAPGMPARQSRNFFRPENFPDAADKFREQMVYKGYGRAIHSSLKTIINNSHLERYQRLADQQKPLLLIWGEEDQIVPFAESSGVRQALGSPPFVQLPETGHGPQSEQPAAVNAALLDWLRR